MGGREKKKEGGKKFLKSSIGTMEDRQLYVQMRLCISQKEIITRTNHVGK